MWLWYNFGAGSSIACSYRFRQILYGAEQYHSGIIKTDGVTPSPGGDEYEQFIRELKELRKFYQSSNKMPEKIVSRKSAILWNHENFWSLNRQSQTRQWDAWGYPGKYQEILKSFGAPVDIIGESADLSKYKFVIIPAYELVDSTLVNKWNNYAQSGGHLVITCRTATKDRRGHFWEAECAAPITGLIGAHITATDMLPWDVQGEVSYKSTMYQWNNWCDLVQPEKGTEVIATYCNQFYAGKAAVVKRALGKGTVTYIGVDTDSSKLESDILREIFMNANVTTENYPEGIYVNWRGGFYVAVNFSSDNYSVNLPANANIMLGEKMLKPAGVLVWTE
jgi:beta-galactosidase